jgi:hypothetical protein
MSGGSGVKTRPGKKSKKSQHDRKDQNALRKNKAFQQLKRDMEQRARNRAKQVKIELKSLIFIQM